MGKNVKPGSNFVSRNLVAIVMIPSIIAFHYGWSVMQKNRTLVKEHEEIDLPLVTFAKYCMRKMSVSDDQVTKPVKS